MDSKRTLSFEYARKFGIEIEVNDTEKRDFKANPLQKGELPQGIDYLGMVINKAILRPVEIKKWHNTHHNDLWIVKPDSSCGLEVCSPVSKGWNGLREICKVIDAISDDNKISVDHRCSLHCHVDVSDCPLEELAAIVAWWIKCECVFLDSVPDYRKVNRYCEFIGMSEELTCDWDCQGRAAELVSFIGRQKYFTANTFHMMKDNRQTMEFRIIENEGCRDAYLVKNWVRLLVHLVERAREYGTPKFYQPDDPFTGLKWLDPQDVMAFLGFDGEFDLSKGMEQTRNWFLARLHANMNSKLTGVFSGPARQVAKEQVNSLVAKLGLDAENMAPYLKTKNQEILFTGGN